jgi:Na+/citrate or Na+/malate symporter
MSVEIMGRVPPKAADAGWLQRWWRLLDVRIGIVPVPVFVVLIGLIAAFVALAPKTSPKAPAPPAAVAKANPVKAGASLPTLPSKAKALREDPNKFPSDILMNIAVLAVGGFACAELGKRLPFLSRIGAAAIFATFVPSFLVFAHLLPTSMVTSITDFTKQSNFLYLFISAIIVGSILGMDRRVLISGFLKIFIPLAAGSLAALAVGSGVGVALGLGLHHTLFFILAPVMAGGVGEGAIPLSIGYAAITHQDQGDLFAQILPSVMMGSLIAILLSGALNLLGERMPRLTGNGRLQPEEDHVSLSSPPLEEVDVPDTATIAAAGVTAATLYLVGVLVQRLTNFPAPVTMLAFAVVLKLGRLVSPRLERGAYVVYNFFSTAVTYPLLFAIGVALTPWDKLIAAFTLPVMLTIAATVTTLVGVGFLTGLLLKMYPIDTAIVTACRAGQGGTGDVAILSAAGRMQLMPFAQIATRIGGALTVTLTLIALARFS